MHSTRRKAIVALALDLLQQWWHEAVELFEANPSSDERIRQEVEVGSRIMFAPTDAEMVTITAAGKGGNWRTKELVTLAFHFLQERLDDLDRDYYYQGEQERFNDTHLTFGDTHFARPTQQDVEDLLSQIDQIVKALPPVVPPQIAWDIYDLVAEDEPDRVPEPEWIDRVFFTASCDRQYVENSLKGHDGYNESIVCVPRAA